MKICTIHKPFLLLGSAILLAGFQNCGGPFSALGSNATVDTPQSVASQIPSTVIIEDGSQPPEDCSILMSELQKYPTAKLKSFKSFGAKGDGINDDYEAFKALATEISNKDFSPRQIIYFPAGRYYINRFARGGNVEPNSNTDIQYVNSKNFSLIGCQAAIDVKGDFTMVNDWTRPAANNATAYFTNSKQITPFVFDGASNFKLSGFEINGNVNKLKRDTPQGGVLAETRSHAIITGACSDYELSSLRIHHFAADGLYLGGNKKADFNVQIDHLESHNNARQGLSIIQAGNVKITNSTFRDTGKTEGTYQGHSPQAGVDIEPNFTPESGASLRTGNILFENCTFKDNLGSQFVTNGFGTTVEKVTFRKSEFTAGPGNSPYVIIFPITEGVIEDSVIDTGSGAIYPSWAGPTESVAKVNTILRRNTIKSQGSGVIISTGSKVVIEDNTFVGLQDPTKSIYFPYIQNGVIKFTGNKIHYDTQNFFDPAKNQGTYKVVALLQNLGQISNNTFSTNRTDADFWIGTGGSTVEMNNTLTGRIIFR